MSQAMKCDRCKKIEGERPQWKIITWSGEWNPREIDLCRDCSKSLEQLMDTWWPVKGE